MPVAEIGRTRFGHNKVLKLNGRGPLSSPQSPEKAFPVQVLHLQLWTGPVHTVLLSINRPHQVDQDLPWVNFRARASANALTALTAT